MRPGDSRKAMWLATALTRHRCHAAPDLPTAKRTCRQLDHDDKEWSCTCTMSCISIWPTSPLQVRAIGFKKHCHVSAAGGQLLIL